MMATRVGSLSVQVNAEGWNKDASTPVKVVVWQGDVKAILEDDDPTNDPESYAEVVMDANTKWNIDAVTEKGDYTLMALATPVLEDGTLFKVPEAQVANVGSTDVTVTFDLEKLDLATATEEEKQEAAEAAEESATASGDESKAQAADQAVKKSVPTYQGHNAFSNGGSSSVSTPSGNSGNTGNSGNSGNSGGQSSQPVHQHNFQPVYGERQVPIYGTETVTVCQCGLENPGREHGFECPSGGSTHNEYRDVITGYTSESYVKYYQCSCGATK